MSVQKIVIKGTEQTLPVNPKSADDIVELRKSYLIGGNVRGLTESHDIDLKKDDLVELVFNDETKW